MTISGQYEYLAAEWLSVLCTQDFAKGEIGY